MKENQHVGIFVPERACVGGQEGVDIISAFFEEQPDSPVGGIREPDKVCGSAPRLQRGVVCSRQHPADVEVSIGWG